MNCKKNAKSRSDDEHRLFDPAVEKVVELGLERLRPFENHPFKVKEDEAMARLMESIERYGIMNLLIVMPTRMMKKVSLMTTMRSILLRMLDLIMMSWNLWTRTKEEKCWKMQDWIRMNLIFKRRIQRMKSNIEMKMELMERRQAVHANKIQALMLMITVMQIPEKEKNRKILKAVRVSTALLWLLTYVEDLVLMIRKNYSCELPRS